VFQAQAQSISCNTQLNLPDTICAAAGLNTSLNIPSNASIQWDFCAGSAFGAVSMTEGAPLIQANLVSNLQGLQIVKDNGNYYGFFVAPAANSFFRINFGTRLTNPNPTIGQIFSFGTSFSNPGGFGMVNQPDGWYSINGGRNNISFNRLYFGNNITNNFQGTYLSCNPSPLRVSCTRVVRDGSNYYTIAGAENESGINVFGHGNSLANNNITNRFFTFGVPVRDIELVNHCGEYIAFAISNGNRVFRLNFGSSMANTPAISEITSAFPASITEFTAVHALSDKGLLAVYVMSRTASTSAITMHRGIFNFGVGSFPVVSNLPIPNATSPVSSLEITRDSTGAYVGIGLYSSTIPAQQRIIRFDFSNNCDASFSLSNEQLPTNVRYGSSGKKQITATVQLANNQVFQLADSTVITDSLFAKPTALRVCGSPSVLFIDSACISTNDTLSYFWQFGDGDTSHLQRPQHAYVRDDLYQVSLTVTGRRSTITRSTKILYQRLRPRPAFSYTVGVCSGLPVNFTNASLSALDTIKAYNWQFDTLGTSTLANPVFTFNKPGEYNVSLRVTAKSGCDSTITKVVRILATPIPLISRQKVCFGDTTQFIDSSNVAYGPYTYLWEFGDGSTSTQANPRKKFATQGTFPIRLTLNNSQGCTGIGTRNIQINPLPRANFKIIGNSFTGDSVFFGDSSLVALQVVSRWNWTFSDAYSSDTVASGSLVGHLFSQPGTYKVSLKITTSQGCIDTISKYITVRLSCPIVQINASRIGTIDTPTPVSISTGGALKASYDFCEGDLANSPFGLSLQIPTTNNNRITIVKDKGKFFGFLTNTGDNNANNQFIRLDFDSSLNRSPRPVLMGNPQFALVGPCQMQFIKEGNNWFGLTANASNGNNNLVRLNFGTAINSASITTTVTNLNGALNRPTGLELVKDGDSLYAFICNAQTNNQGSSFVRLSYGRSITNTPRITSLTNSVPLQSGSSLTSVFVFKNCNIWHVFTTASSGQVYRLDYGTSLSSIPSVTNISNDLNISALPNAALINLVSVNVHRDQGHIYLYLTNALGNVIRVRYEQDLRTVPSLVESQGNWGIIRASNGLTFVKDNSVWYTFTAEKLNTTLYRFRYANHCSNPVPAIDTTANATLAINYSMPGTYYYSVSGTDALGNTVVVNDSINVSGVIINPTVCPTLSINVADQACVNAPLFVSVAAGGSTDVEVDACVGDLGLTPAPIANSGVFAPNVYSQFDIVRDGTDYFGFIYSGGESRLSRLSYGNSLENAPLPTEFNTIVANQVGLKMFKSAGNWFGLSTGATTNLISFGNRLSNAPNFSTIGTGNATRSPKCIEIAQEANQTLAVMANVGAPLLTLMRFGKDVNNIPEIDTVNIVGAASTSSVSMLKECNKWYGMATDFNGNGIVYFYFPNGLSANPVATRIPNSVLTIPQPQGCKLVRDGAIYYLFVSSNTGDLYRIKLGNSLANPSYGTPVNLGIFGVLSSMLGFSMERMDNSQWYLMGYASSRNIVRLKFPNNCSATPAIYRTTAPNIRYATSGVNYIGVTVKDINGNISVLGDSIIVRNPIAGQIGLAGQRCTGGITIFSDQSISTNPVPPIRQWNFGDTVNTVIQSDLANPTHVYRSPGTYNVTLRLIESSGCSAIVSRVVQIVAKPRPNFTFRAQNCTNDSVQISDASIAGRDTIKSWVYTFNGQVVSRRPNFSLFFTNLGFNTITLTVTGAAGCDTSITKTIEVLTIGPSVQFDTPVKTCFGDTTNFIGQVNDQGLQVTSQTWSLDPGVFRTELRPKYLYRSPGERNVSLTVRLSNNCSRTFNRRVIIYRKPQGIITVQNQPCEGFPVQFDYNLSLLEGRVIRNVWSFSDGTSDTLKNPVKVFPARGTYYASVRVTTSGGCEAIFRDTIDVSNAPKAGFSFVPRCAGRFTAFTDTSNANNLPGGIKNYSWDFGNGITSNSSTPDSVRYDNPGRYLVSLRVIANGCPNTISQYVLIPPSPEPVIAVNEGCDGVPYTFTDSSTVGGVYMPNSSRIWTIDGRTFTGRSISIVLINGQNYDIILQSTSPEGCTNTIPKSLIPGSKPIARFSILDTVFTTQPYRTRFLNSSIFANRYLWKFGDGDTSTVISPTHNYAREGVYTVTLLAYRNNRCFDSVSRVVNVISNIQPDLELSNLSTSVSNGLMTISVGLQNIGNVEIKSAELSLQLNQLGTIIETYKGSLLPSAKATYTFVSKIVDSLNRPNSILCIGSSILINNVVDKNPINNRLCKALNGGFNILDIFPNPTGGSVTLNYTLPNEGAISINLVDALGRAVMLLEDSRKQAGVYSKNYDISALPEGLYHIQFSFENEVRNQRIVKF